MLCPLADTGRSHLPRPPVCRRSSPRRTPEPSIDLKHGRSDQLPSARTTRSGTLLRRKSVNVSPHERRLFRSAGRAGRQVWHPETLATKARAPRARNDTPLPCPSGENVAEMFRSISSDAIQGLRDRALLAVMYSTALRCVSLLRASVDDVDFATGTLRHQPKGHREKDAIAVLSTTASTALADYLAARGPLTSGAPLFAPVGNRRSASGRLSTRSMRNIVLSLSEIAGLARRSKDGKVLNPGHFSAHSIRRAAVTVAVAALDRK